MPCLNSLNKGDFLWISGGINLLHNIMMLLKNVELFNQLMLQLWKGPLNIIDGFTLGIM